MKNEHDDGIKEGYNTILRTTSKAVSLLIIFTYIFTSIYTHKVFLFFWEVCDSVKMKIFKFKIAEGYSHDDEIFNMYFCFMKLNRFGAHILIIEITGEGNNSLQLPFQKKKKLPFQKKNPVSIFNLGDERLAEIIRYSENYAHIVLQMHQGVLYKKFFTLWHLELHNVSFLIISTSLCITIFNAKAMDETLSIVLGLRRSSRTQRSY